MRYKLWRPGTRKGNRTRLARGTVDGRQFEKVLEATTRADAEKEAERFVASIQGYRPGQVITFEQAARAYVEFRRPRRDDAKWIEQLYKILSARVLRALPTADAADGTSRSLTRERIREKVYGRFVEMLAGDRQVYDERLDFFEIRFDMALKRLRQDAQRQAWRDENRSQPLTYESDSGELSPEIERAAGSTNPFEAMEIDDEAFRLRLDAAIEALPSEQSRTIQMLMLEYQIHSEDPNVITICTVLKKTPKTIWNYRDRAMKTLRSVLIEGEDQ